MITHWIQKDGVRIRIVDMTDQHLTNAINMLERFAYRTWECAIRSGPPNFNGDMAQYYADQMWDQLIEDGPEYPPIYDALCAERDKRKLTVAIAFAPETIVPTGNEFKPKGKRK